MRTLATVILAALIATALAPSVIPAEHRQKPHGDHHNAATVPHGQTTIHNHDGHGHAHGHTFLQRIHNALFGRYHVNGTCPPEHNDTHDSHNSHSQVGHSRSNQGH